MRTITATQASRNFSDLLDAIQRGEHVAITRGGRPVAQIGPIPTRTWADLAAALDGIPPPDDELSVAAISLAEYGTGVQLAATDVQRQVPLAAMIDALEVLTYSSSTAAHHAHLLAAVRRAGRLRGAHDLIIVAHAVETGREVLTLDGRARFDDLPGVIMADE